MRAARQVTVDEVLTAAREQRLFERGDGTMSWYAIDDQHIGLDPVQSLIGHGVLGLVLDVYTPPHHPKAIYLRSQCAESRDGQHKIGERWLTIVDLRDGGFVINGEIYRRTGE